MEVSNEGAVITENNDTLSPSKVSPQKPKIILNTTARPVRRNLETGRKATWKQTQNIYLVIRQVQVPPTSQQVLML